jgi:hypothetical protein
MGYFNVPAVSNSGMSGLNPNQGGSPRIFKSIKQDAKYSLSLDRGSLLHLAILEPDKFIVQDVDRPSGMMGAFVEALYQLELDSGQQAWFDPSTKQAGGILLTAKELSGYKTSTETVWNNFQKPDAQAYYEYLKTTPGKLAVTRDTREILDECISNLRAHPVAKKLLFEEDDDIATWNEEEIYWEEPIEIIDQEGFEVVVNVPCKIKVDRLRYNSRHKRFQNVDLKTSGKGLGRFGDSFRDFRYYRQNAFYDLGIRRFAQQLNLEVNGISHLNVVVETVNLHEVGVFKSTPEWLEKGRLEYEEVLKRYAWHQHHNLWEYPMEYYLNNGLLTLPNP